ncbi:MSCRAMM family protein, partial [Lederbergia graminis]
YKLDETPIVFTIEKGQEITLTVKAENELITGSVELIKVDKDDNKLTLEGAVFALQTDYGETIQEELTTDAEGRITVDNLKPGNYQFIETKAPDYYQLDAKPIAFEIVKSQKEAFVVMVENELIRGEVVLTKVDIDNENAPLVEVEFSLQTADGKVISEGLKTNDEGEIFVNNLKPGDYQFIEMAAPFGYDLDPTPINFTIEKAKTVDDVKQIEVT